MFEREGGNSSGHVTSEALCRRHFTFFFEVCELFDNCPVSERYSILCVWSGHILYFTHILSGPIVWSDSIMLDEWYVQNLSMFCGLVLRNWRTFACCSWIQSVYCHWFFCGRKLSIHLKFWMEELSLWILCGDSQSKAWTSMLNQFKKYSKTTTRNNN